MRTLITIFVVLCALTGAALPATKKPVATKRTATAKKSTPAKNKGKAVAKKPAATWRTRQQAPSPDRYKEIQQALADKGFLKAEADGVWDAESVTAMRNFQTAQNLTASGKITAPALIALGLGPVRPERPLAGETPPKTE